MRVLLKLSWEGLSWEKWAWYDTEVLMHITEIIREIVDMGVELWIVIGGWNLVRGSDVKDFFIYYWHNMWMLASSINAIWLTDFFNRAWVKARSFHSFNVDWLMEKFNKVEVSRCFEKREVVVFWWWTGNPYFTTDTWWILRALEIWADLVIKATKVDWVYDKDPIKYSDAKKFDELTYNDVLDSTLKVMDLTAISMAKDYNLPIIVVSFKDKDSIIKAIKWEKIWTIIK